MKYLFLYERNLGLGAPQNLLAVLERKNVFQRIEYITISKYVVP